MMTDYSVEHVGDQYVGHSDPANEYDVGIVGAGPAGLTLAYVGHYYPYPTALRF